MALFGKAFCLLSVGFVVFNIGLEWLLLPGVRKAANVLNVGMALQLAAAVIPAVQWVACRSGERSARAVDVCDAGGALLIMLAYSVMSWVSPPSFEQGFLLALITICVLVTRAVVVPSTGVRTLWIGVMCSLPPVIATWLILSGGGQASPLVDPEWLRKMGALYIALWCGLGVALSTLASRVIYGLVQRVREVTELGQYTLEEKIGQGGMGVVYRARHALLRRPTAVKLLATASDQARARFEREVQLTSALTHPNTVAIYDYGHTPDGVFYYAMEYLDGITLEDLVEHDGPQPTGRVVHLLRQVTAALAEAHAVGLVHRDIKPANLMVCDRGQVADFMKVLDFGLAKDLTPETPSDLSTANMLVGTPLYLAPESILDSGSADARTDLYALGAVAYFLLTGAPPFVGTNLLDVCSKHLHTPPEPLASRSELAIPAQLEALVLRCLAKDASDRPASAGALLGLLDDCDVDRWSDIEARRWWTEAAPEVRRRVHAQHGAPGTAPPTLAIDYARRGWQEAPSGAVPG